MLNVQKIYFSLLDFSLGVLTTSKIISFGINSFSYCNPNKPIVYVLPYNSTVDLLILRKQCLRKGLPDPLAPLYIKGMNLPRYIYITRSDSRSLHTENSHAIFSFHNYLDLHYLNPELDIQLMPVLVIFSRSPDRELQLFQKVLPFRLVKKIRKFFSILWSGRSSLILFSQALSLHDTAFMYGSDRLISKKLARVARIHFIRQRLAVVGPNLPRRQHLCNKLLALTIIKKLIADQAQSKSIPIKKVQQNAIKIIEEIAANFSYKAVRLSDQLLRLIWNYLYQGLHVHNADKVRHFAEKGYEIVYIPCHRSHMDYFLLSYTLYHQGLVPPHIAAGANLNFWPIGQIFRRLGAFFIRRTFKGNKLYTAIFRAYLCELFVQGCSVEYFIEGSRSRTGRLLDPKTGTLTMTIQALLSNRQRSVVLVPVYIGYECIIEVKSYSQELRGTPKMKEGVWQTVKGLCKLRNLGLGYVNFGDPIFLSDWLSSRIPQWRNSVCVSPQRPSWLSSAVHDIATIIMVRINNAAITNAINLCSTIILASCQKLLTRLQLLSQLSCYLQLLHNVPYSDNTVVSNLTPEAVLTHALKMKTFSLKRDVDDDIIHLSSDQTILTIYYRNNIQHLFILPSLVARIVCSYPGVTREKLHSKVKLLYPFLKAKLFMRYSVKQLSLVIDNLIAEFSRQGLIKFREIFLYPVRNNFNILTLLAANANDTIYCYAITFSLLYSNPHIDLNTLKKESSRIGIRLSTFFYGFNAPELFDESVFYSLADMLYTEKYVTSSSGTRNTKIRTIYDLLGMLLTPDIFTAIKKATLLAKTVE